MHEMALVTGIMDTVRDSARVNGITKVASIRLVIGKLTMALPDSLQFAFTCLSEQEALFTGAVLEIVEVEIVGKCRLCQSEFTLNEVWDQCPHCTEGTSWDLLKGRELYIDSYEGDGD